MSAATADARLHTLLLIELLTTLSNADEDDEHRDGPARAAVRPRDGGV
jgi:hypothetical protein